MSDNTIATFLVENSVHSRRLVAEHGLAFHIRAGTDSLLFDTGQSALLAHDAQSSGVDPTLFFTHEESPRTPTLVSSVQNANKVPTWVPAAPKRRASASLSGWS